MSNETTESIDWDDFTSGASITATTMLVTDFVVGEPFIGAIAVLIVLLGRNLWPETRWAKDE